jgi:hypothetical protein
VVRILVDAPVSGQFIQRVAMPLGTPDVLVGDQAYVRRWATLPGSQVHVVEAWGESSAISAGVLTVAPGPDVVALPHASMVALPAACAEATCTLEGLTITRTVVGSSTTAIGRVITLRFVSSRWRVDVEIVAHWRSPWALVDGAVRCRYVTADGYSTRGLLTIPGYGTFAIDGTVLGVVVAFRGIARSQLPGDVAVPMPAPGAPVDYPPSQPRPRPEPPRQFEPPDDPDDPELYSSRMVSSGRMRSQTIRAGNVSRSSTYRGGGAEHLVESLTASAPQDPGVMEALDNAERIYSRALPETWTSDWLNMPGFDSPFTRQRAGEISHALSPRIDPNAPGSDGCFGCTTYPILWCSDGARRETADDIGRVVAPWLARRASWLGDDGETIVEFPARSVNPNRSPFLTCNDGLPWIQSNPIDALGTGLTVGQSWPRDAGRLEGHDAQHEAAATLASDVALHYSLASRITARAKASQISYDRGYVVALTENPTWLPFGRGGARPLMALCNLAAVDWTARSIVQTTGVAWVNEHYRQMLARGIPRSLPCHVGALGFPTWTAYEEGLLGQAALAVWRITGNLTALELAYRCGRHVATTVFITGTAIECGYEVTWLGTGSPTPRSQMSVAGNSLRIWTIGGLNTLLGAKAAMTTLGIAGEATDSTWTAQATAARALLTGFALNENAGEQLAAVNQTLWNVSPSALGRRVG